MRGIPVDVVRPAPVLAVVVLGDAVEGKPAVEAVQRATRGLQVAVRLLPLHQGSRPAETQGRKKRNGLISSGIRCK